MTFDDLVPGVISPENLIVDGVEPRFKVLHRIGHGAFGEVFKAKDLVTGDVVALKRIYVRQPQRGVSKSASNEVAVLQKLNHDNIVRLLDVHRQNGYLTLVMEHCETDLTTWMTQSEEKRLGHIQATSCIKQLFTALAHCHQQQIVHRDLKPSNLLLDSNAVIKVGDFGQSRFMEAHTRFTPTVTSRWYRAPELLFASRSYDASVDIWAAALIYIELLTGRPFVAGESDLEQISRTMETFGSIDEDEWPEARSLPDYGKILFDTCPRRPLQQMLPQLHPLSVDFLERTLQYNPNKRLTAVECLNHPLFHRIPDVCPRHYC